MKHWLAVALVAVVLAFAALYFGGGRIPRETLGGPVPNMLASQGPVNP
jgi:hypothetical protein